MMDIKRNSIFILNIIVLLAGCNSPRKPLFLEPPDSPPVFSSEQLQCIIIDDTDNNQADVVTAVESRTDTQKFADWLLQMESKDPLLFSSIRNIGNGQVTIFLPTDIAVQAFNEEYSHVTLSDEKLVSLVRHHILIQWFGWEDLLQGARRPRTVNQDELIYWKDENYCGFVGDSAHVLIADDICKNGVLHIIDKVRIPKGFQ